MGNLVKKNKCFEAGVSQGDVATSSKAGLMSKEDKTKLDGISSGAQKNTITGIKGNAESSYRTGNVNLTPENIGALPEASRNIVPSGDRTYDLGATGALWNHVYANELNFPSRLD